MSEFIHNKKPNEDDKFFRIVNDLRGQMNVRVEAEHVVVPLANDMRLLRAAYDDHVKEAIAAEPDAPLRIEDYNFIEMMLNRKDVLQLPELQAGDKVVVGEGAFTAYQTDSGVACENVVEGERIVGNFSHIAVAPVPTLDAMIDGSGTNENGYDVALVLSQPQLEIAGYDDPHRIQSDYIVVSISDPSVEISKRL